MAGGGDGRDIRIGTSGELERSSCGCVSANEYFAREMAQDLLLPDLACCGKVPPPLLTLHVQN